MHAFRLWAFSFIKKIKKRFDTVKSKTNIKQVIAITLIVVGVALVGIHPLYRKLYSLQESAASASANPIQPDKRLLEGKADAESLPVRIIIPDISVDLPVVPAKVVNHTWETSETAASFGLGSALPGNGGNSVIFAHARIGLFGGLRNLKKDAIVYVYTKKEKYSYKVDEIKTVSPKDTEVIAPTPDDVLTLYTCSGFADTKRLIVRAKKV